MAEGTTAIHLPVIIRVRDREVAYVVIMWWTSYCGHGEVKPGHPIQPAGLGLKAADSTGQRNPQRLGQFLRWSHKAQGLPRPFIEPLGNCVQLSL